MKLDLSNPAFRRARGESAMTLVEVMMASAIMAMVIAALVTANLIGMKQFQLVDSKSGASDTSRAMLDKLGYDIKASKYCAIGNPGMYGNFTPVFMNQPQKGSMLRLCPTASNSMPAITYYFQTNAGGTGMLRRKSTEDGSDTLIATNLVDWLGDGFVFKQETYNGILSSNQGCTWNSRGVIHVKLQFCQFQYPLTDVGTNGLYDFYKIEFKAGPHVPE